jgi:hypothetical protein
LTNAVKSTALSVFSFYWWLLHQFFVSLKLGLLTSLSLLGFLTILLVTISSCSLFAFIKLKLLMLFLFMSRAILFIPIASRQKLISGGATGLKVNTWLKVSDGGVREEKFPLAKG